MKSRRILRWAGLTAVVLVPLAFAGLFVGAIGGGQQALEQIPVAIVNDDAMQTVTQPDGSEQIVFAGRQLVTELVGAEGFDWTITNGEDAQAALEVGDVYAVLTVPQNFSTSILSLSSDDPQQADISIRTDDAHSYLTGSVAQVVGQTMTDTFGNAITAQYIGGIYSSLGDLGASLTAASDGATQLANGATSLSGGLVQYTDGVDALAGGLSQLESGAAGLSQLSAGIAQYTGSVSQLSAGLSALAPALSSADPAVTAQFQGIVAGLAQAASGGGTLSAQATSGIAGVQSGISQSADGAWQLSSGATALVDGANGLAAGATALATGLTDGAAQIPDADVESAAASAEIAADPVQLQVTTDNPVSEVGQAVATFFVPLGLWIGALAVFLVLRPVTRRALASTARNGRLVGTAILKASAITVAQAVLLVALLHGALGVAWSLLPATLGFSLLVALAFTAFHYLLTIGLGRAGLVVSLFVLAVQVTSTGGVYPIELLSAPFQLVSPFLPLTWAVNGMQGIIAGGSVGSVVGAALVLAAFGAVSAVLSLVAIRRTRRASALGLVLRAA
jgi:putative membrane protein